MADPGISNRGGARDYVHAAHTPVVRIVKSLTGGAGPGPSLKTLFNIVEERLQKLLNYDVSAV